MKKIFIVVVGLLFCVGSFGQKNFEGEIVYSVKSLRPTDDAVVKILFGINKIKMNVKLNGKKEFESNYIVVNIDSLAQYNIDTTKKKLKKSALNYLSFKDSKEKVLNQSTTVSLLTRNAIDFLFSRFDENLIIYTADSLFFSIPEEVKSDNVFAMIFQNRIILKAISKNIKNEEIILNEKSNAVSSILELYQ